jgi:hypothetical protein
MEQSKIKKVAILLTILFVVSLTAVAVDGRSNGGNGAMHTTTITQAAVSSATGGTIHPNGWNGGWGYTPPQ